MRKTFENLPSALKGVHGLGAEQFIYELGGKHTLYNVLKYLLGALAVYVLRPKSLLQDVNHLAA